MLEALLTAASIVFGLIYLWLKTGDAMRAAWAGVKRWLPSMPVRAAAPSAPRRTFAPVETVKHNAPAVTGGLDRTQREPVVSTGGITGTVSAQTEPPRPPELTDRAVVEWLAKRKTSNSANAIFALVGGNRNEVLAWIREARGETTPDAPTKPHRMIVVRDHGKERRIPMVERKAQYHPDAPELEFEQPPA